MKKKYKNALKIGIGAAALGASNYLGKRAGEQDIAKKILASYTGDTDTVLKKTSAFGIAKPTARSKGGGMDMGAKKPLSFKEQLEKARAEGTVEKSKTSKYLKKRAMGDKLNALLKTIK